jgi:hypothetical protein
MKDLVADLQTKLKRIGALLKINIVTTISGFEHAFRPQPLNKKRIPRCVTGPAEVLNSLGLRETSVLQQVSIADYLVNLGIGAIRTHPLLYPDSLVTNSGGIRESLKCPLTAGHQQA